MNRETQIINLATIVGPILREAFPSEHRTTRMQVAEAIAKAVLPAIRPIATELQSQADAELVFGTEAEPDRCDYEISDDGVMRATDTWQRDNDATCLRLLACHSIDVSDALVASWTDEQVKQADIWVWSCALSASDHDDIQVPPRPDFLPRASSSGMRHLITGAPL